MPTLAEMGNAWFNPMPGGSNYYDPTTFARVDPTKVRTVSGGGAWNSNEVLPDQYWTGDQSMNWDGTDYNPASGTRLEQGNNIDAWGRSQGFMGGAGFDRATSDYLTGLQTQYGLDIPDFQRALTDYNTRNNTTAGSNAWWGDQATGRAFADSLGRVDPRYSAGWTNNPGLEATQQNTLNQGMTAMQQSRTNFGDELGTLGMLGGVAAGSVGLAGLLGGGSALGQGALASQLAAEASSAVPLSGAAGAAAGGGGLAGLGGNALDLQNVLTGAEGGSVPTGVEAFNPGPPSFDPNLGGPGLETSGFQPPGGPDLPTGPSGLDVPGGLDAVSPGTGGEMIPPGPSVPNLPPTPPTGGFQGTDDLASQAASANSGINPYTAPISSLPTSMLSSLAQTLGISESALRTLGTLGLGLGDLLGRSQASNANQANADRAFNMGAPYRDRLAAYYANPSAAIANDPAIQASVNQGTNAMARALSARDGNPTGSGRALQELQNYSTQQLYGQYGNELNRLANFGGLSSFNAAAPGLATNAANSSGDIYSSIGNTVGRLLNPAQSYGDVLRSMGINTPLP